MNTIISQQQPAGEGGAPSWPPLPPPNITPLFNEVLRQACAEWGLPYEPWPLPAAGGAR
jgi:hypothetical protein